MCLHKVPLLWIRYEVWLLEWKGKCFCPEVKAPQTQPGIPLKQLTVGLYTCGCRFSCGAVLPGQAFEFWKASNNNFSKRYRVVHTRSDLSVRRPCIAVLHPASIEVSPCLSGVKEERSISLLLRLDLEFLESTPKTLINSLHATARNFDTPSYWTLTIGLVFIFLFCYNEKRTDVRE